MNSSKYEPGHKKIAKALRLLLIFVPLIFCLFSYAQKGRLQFGHLETNLGLSHVDVMSILRDSHGFMWFGTANGLNKFDGNNFTVYKQGHQKRNNIKSSYVMCMLEDMEGNLWVGDSWGLERFDRDKEEFILYNFPVNNLPDSSSKGIMCLLEDSDRNLWIGTEDNGLDFFDRIHNRFIHYQHDEKDINSISGNSIKSLFEDKEHNLWIGTTDGLNLFDKKRKKFTRFKHNEKDSKSLGHNIVNGISEDNKQRLWIGTYGGGLDLYNKSSGAFTHYKNDPGNNNSLVNNKVSAIKADNAGNLWIGTENNGLSILNPATGEFNNYIHDEIDNHSLNDNSLNSIYKDRHGNMWLGTYSGGVNFWSKDIDLFTHYKHSPVGNSLSNNKVLTIYEDSKENLWIGTDGGGLNLFDRHSGQFKVFKHNGGDKNSICGDNVLGVMEDSEGNLWIATWGEGISVINLQNNTTRHLRNKPSDTSSLNSDFARMVYEDSDKNIWIGTSGGGLNKYNRANNSFTHYLHDNKDTTSINNNFILCIFEDSKDMLWIGTSGRGLNLFNKKDGSFSQFLGASSVFSIHEDPAGNLWLGTEDGLVYYDKKNNRSLNYTKKDGLPDDAVSGITEDSQGNLWLSTLNGLSRFNPSTKKFKNFNVDDGLQANHFIERAYCKSRNGNMYFGGINGFNEFYPGNIRENNFDPPVAITGFQVFNKEVPIAVNKNDPSPLKKHISETKEINLPYSSSGISFEFASLNYTSPRKKQYAYMLEGFDKGWNYIGEKHNATYTNLDPGKYVFKVKSTNKSGEWSSRTVEIRLNITPPFWLTWWFKALLIIFIAGSFGTFYSIRVNVIRKREIELKRMVAERTRQLAHSMDQETNARKETDYLNKELERKNTELEQFAYIASHDLQEPLRTTSSFVALLQQKYQGSMDEKDKKYFTYILQASDRMKDLIKNLLDFSRIGNKKVIEEVDCNKILQDVLADLGIAINEAGAHINYSLLPVINGYSIEIKQLFQNLITNAIKFRRKDTSPQVKISAKKLPDSWEFAFEDNGIGIEAKHQEKIFVIFQRLHTRTEYEGTGIGLSHCKKIVELHHGKIRVESVPGEGSTFYFTLPSVIIDNTGLARTKMRIPVAGI